jgi:hypothetical protein
MKTIDRLQPLDQHDAISSESYQTTPHDLAIASYPPRLPVVPVLSVRPTLRHLLLSFPTTTINCVSALRTPIMNQSEHDSITFSDLVAAVWEATGLSRVSRSCTTSYSNITIIAL